MHTSAYQIAEFSARADAEDAAGPEPGVVRGAVFADRHQAPSPGFAAPEVVRVSAEGLLAPGAVADFVGQVFEEEHAAYLLGRCTRIVETS